MTSCRPLEPLLRNSIRSICWLLRSWNTIDQRHQELLDAIRSGKERIALTALESHLKESYEYAVNSYALNAAAEARRSGD